MTLLLASLIEGNDNEEIRTSLCESLDIQFLKEKLVEQYTNYVKNQLGLRSTASQEQVLSRMRFEKEFDEFHANYFEKFFGHWRRMMDFITLNSRKPGPMTKA